jgi:hypothetical protein
MNAEDLLQTAIKFGDRQTDELARLSRLSVRYRSALFRALNYARSGQMARAIEIIEQELERDRTENSSPASADQERPRLYPHHDGSNAFVRALASAGMKPKETLPGRTNPKCKE